MQLSLNITFNSEPQPDRHSLLGAPITIGNSRKRWRVKGIANKSKPGETNPVNFTYYAFIGAKSAPDSECPMKIVRFHMDDLGDGQLDGDEVGIFLDKKKNILVWLPKPPPEPPIIIG